MTTFAINVDNEITAFTGAEQVGLARLSRVRIKRETDPAQALAAHAAATASALRRRPGVGHRLRAPGGQRLRIFDVVDIYHARVRGFGGRHLDAQLQHHPSTGAIIVGRVRPVSIRSDNGPEMSSRHFLAWCIDAVHIQPGKPTQNAHVESFHGRLRDECLNVS